MGLWIEKIQNNFKLYLLIIWCIVNCSLCGILGLILVHVRIECLIIATDQLVINDKYLTSNLVINYTIKMGNRYPVKKKLTPNSYCYKTMDMLKYYLLCKSQPLNKFLSIKASI